MKAIGLVTAPSTSVVTLPEVAATGQVATALAANLCALVAAILFSASWVGTRVLAQDVPPLSLAVLRWGLGGLALFFGLLIGARHLLHVERRDLPFLALLGVICFSIVPVTMNAGLRLTEVSRGALLAATMPLWSAWIARALAGERLVPRQVGGILVTLAGVAVLLAERGLSWQGTAWSLGGDALLLATALCGALYGVLSKRALVRYPAPTVITYAMLLGTLLLVPLALVEGLGQVLPRLDGRATALILFLGLFPSALGHLLWTFALGRLMPTQVMVYGNLMPPLTTVLGVTLLAETLTGLFQVSFVAVLAGVLLVNWPGRQEPAGLGPRNGPRLRPAGSPGSVTSNATA